MKFHCPDCGQKLEVATIYAGQQTACPACSAKVRIPEGEPALQPAEINTAILESLETGPAAAGGTERTIAQFMSDRKIEGGVKLGTEVLTSDQNRKYEYGDVVARGGMGAIIRATDQNVRRDVAMKVLLDPSNASNLEILRFIEEAQVTGQLEHPGVVPVHDLGVDGAGNVFYTMKFVRGETLHAILTKISKRDQKTIDEYSLNRLLNVFQKVCEAMAFAHSKDVIHRDLKPENIMVGEFGEVLVMDWGLAKVLSYEREDPYVSEEQINSVRQQDISGALATVSGTIFGTPQFMAPEQAAGETRLMDQRTDIYALGAILYNILTLHPPVDGKTVDEVLKKVSTGEILTPTAYNTAKQPKRVTKVPGLPEKVRLFHCPGERIPEALGAITMKAMAVKQEDRYQTTSAMLDDIEKFQGGFATEAEDASFLKLAALFLKRNKLAALSILVIAALGIAFVATTIINTNEIRAVSRKAAPKFVEEARLAFANEDDSGARESINTAIGLHEQLPDAWLELARLEFADFEFGEAIRALDRANAAAEDKAAIGKAVKYREIAARWRKQTAKDGVLPEIIFDLATEIEPFDSVLAGRIYGKSEDKTKALQLRVVNALRGLEDANPGLDLEMLDNMPWAHVTTEDGLKLNFHYQDRENLKNIGPLRGLPIVHFELFTHPVSDLSPLQDMPIETLILHGTKVVGLNSLRDLPLKYLDIGGTEVSDIEPLRGKPLQTLNLSGSKVGDLSPLQGMPLEILNLSRCQEATNFESLRGLQLKEIDLMLCAEIQDIGFLEGMPLESVILGGHPIRELNVLRDAPLRYLEVARCPVEDLSALAGKNFETLELENLQTNDLSIFSELKTLQLILSHHELTNLDDLAPLTTMNRMTLHGNRIENIQGLRSTALVNLTMRCERLTDLSPLAGLPLEYVLISAPEATDLSAFQGSETLAHFEFSGKVADISPLAGLPLRIARFMNCDQLRDLTPLAQCQDLESVIVPKTAGNLEFLLQLPNLRSISYDYSEQDPETFVRQHGDGQPVEN